MPEPTRKVFRKLSGLPFISTYTLVGGTALAMQIRHRLSEDLDFILDGQKLSSASLKRNMGRHFPDFRIIREDESDQVDFVIDTIRVTFFSSGAVMIPFEVKPHARSYKKVNIASPEIIGVLKLSAISQRNTFRDYYDLYMLAKHHIPLEQLIRQTKELNPGLSSITYSETMIYTRDLAEDSIANHLSPAETVTKEDISGFFVRELRRIRDVI
ncbi:MAG: nucleotidyl transferase AbiEii/AbiGii toxin family protein [Bacteroidales bacterium]|nr:nucleotidyl transferase AbiEii/AbiGii toxin family protein [Bacteroidales bacterium]